MSASLSLKDEVDIDAEALTPQKLNEWLLTKKIVYGVNQQVVQTICNDPRNVKYPIEIAKGKNPENGMDAYLINEVDQENQSVSTEENQQFNFKNIRKIPSVKSGQLLATIVPPTLGFPGKDVYGNVLTAKPGKKLRLKPGQKYHFSK